MEIIRHLFLFLFFIAFTISVLLAGYLHFKGPKKIGRIFLLAGLFMFFWYASSYLVMNIIHRDTVFYTTLEVCAFLAAAAALFQIVTIILYEKLNFQAKKPVLALVFIIPIILFILSKYSHHIWGFHPPVFYIIKQTAFWVLVGTYIIPLMALTLRKKSLYGLLGLLLPIALVIDTWVIRDKFYSGDQRLSMNYPVLITLYLIFALWYGVSLLRKRGDKKPSPSIKLDELSAAYKITSREKEIITLIIQGKSNQEIGEALFISLGTVKNHLHNIYRKCGISSRFELISLMTLDTDGAFA